MRWPTFRLRTLMIAVAVLAPVMAVGGCLLQLDWALDDFYGPGGFLDRQHKLSNMVAAADAELDLGRFVEAEALYRSALKLAVEHVRRSHPTQFVVRTDWFVIGLADAVAGQGKAAEADPLYRKAVAIYGEDAGPENTASDGVLMRYAAFLRHEGRKDEARAREDQAIAALDRSAAHFRLAKRDDVAEALEARATAIRDGQKP